MPRLLNLADPLAAALKYLCPNRRTEEGPFRSTRIGDSSTDGSHLTHRHSLPSKQTAVITATYNYTDEAGRLIYQVVRQEPKAFLQRRPDGAGGWIWRKSDRQVLYRLSGVLEAPIVFVVEGEKDVETLRGYGFVATTNSGGAKAPWLDSYTETMRDRECILVPDNDPAGWERVVKIAKALLGTAARIRVLDLPPEHKDISEWFGGGHSECELITMLEGVHAV